jgi:predicted carbohydrate-binding protein with CBM5 and CBM33 domain
VFRLVGVLTLLMMVSAVPAHAHGAPTDPASRAFLCSPGQATASSSPCRNAIRAGLPSTEWDNIRLANVAGRDTARVPDGKLCSAGIAKYAGLDAPTAEWPATKLKSTAFTYRATIPHQGSFRFYVTREGYSPSRALRWADLEQFLSVPTPPLVNGAYEFKVQLPKRTGRHLIYTVWQNTDTPDTYYSCTDVEIAAPAAPAPAPAPAPAAPPAPQAKPVPPAQTAAPVSSSAVPSTPKSSTPRPVPVASSAEQPPSSATRFGMSAVVAALGGLVVLGGIMLWRKRIL